MKRAAINFIFWLLLVLAFTFLVGYVYTVLNTKNSAMITRDLRSKASQTIPIYEIRDVEYTEAGSVATISFNLINMGEPLTTKAWLLQFLTPDGKTICRTTIFTGDPTEAGRVNTEIYIPARNVTISDVDKGIYTGEVAQVTIQLLETCLNETINYARTGEKMVIRLTIPPTSSSVITNCNIDPNTGFATCTE